MVFYLGNVQKLSEILPHAPARYSLSADATASQVLHAAEEYLSAIFGAENIGQGKNVAAQKLQQGLLCFSVRSAAWNNRLFLEKTGLLEQLQKEFPKLELRDVRGKVDG